MKNFFKGKVGTTIIILATILLAGVAIFTAIRLYQLRTQPVAPNVPSSFPQAAENTCTLSFSLAAVTSTPTSTATATATATSTSTATATATGTATPTSTGTATPQGTGTPAPTQPSLPSSGTSWPTLVGAGLGIFVILGAFLLAL